MVHCNKFFPVRFGCHISGSADGGKLVGAAHLVAGGNFQPRALV